MGRLSSSVNFKDDLLNPEFMFPQGECAMNHSRVVSTGMS